MSIVERFYRWLTGTQKMTDYERGRIIAQLMASGDLVITHKKTDTPEQKKEKP